MHRQRCRILENKLVAPGHFILKFASKEIASHAKPGQFVQILCSGSYDPLLPRPFSFLDASDKDFSVLYHTVGKGTKILSEIKTGESLWVSGPFGNGFETDPKKEEHYLIGGGVGIPPLYHLAKEMRKNKIPAKNIHIFLGARNKSLLLCEKEFKKLGVVLHLATDDGSKAHKGYVTEVLSKSLKEKNPSKIKMYTCGPTPMLIAVSEIAKKFNVACEVSVEVPMACGFGACIGCAIKVVSDEGHRFAIACQEGPVFQAEKVSWES